MTTLVLGGSGQLGSEFARVLSDVVAPTRQEFDLADTDRIEPAVAAIGPARIINCAAYTAVDAAEGDERAASTLNGKAVGEMAHAAATLGIPFITFSSDYVFAGEADQPYLESSPPQPINAYGRSKLLGERSALQYPGSLVVRTSWLLAATHSNFVKTILGKAATGTVSVVDDQRGRPTLVSDLVPAVLDLVDRGLTGLLHLANPPTTTWFGLAREACRLAGIDPERIVACSTDQYPRPAPRPRYSVLASERSVAMPDWRAGLPDLVARVVAR